MTTHIQDSEDSDVSEEENNVDSFMKSL